MAESEIPEQIQPDLPEEIPLTPVSKQERIAAMDVLRGIAVFGIFLINMPLYVAPSAAFFEWQDNVLWTSPADRLATLFLFIFAQGKFYTLFSFLFGVGFGVQLLRAAERHAADFLPVYRRRLTVLLILGLLHFTLVWWGDVLHVYALLGFVLLLFREMPDKELLVWAACLTLIPFSAEIVGTSVERLMDTTTGSKVEAKRKKKQEAEAHLATDLRTNSSGTIPEILRLRLQTDVRQLGRETFWSAELFASFLAGLWVSRQRILQEPHNYRPLLRKLAFVGLPLAIVYSSLELSYGYLHPTQELPLWRVHLALIREYVARPAMAFGYAAAVLLIGIRRWMNPFAAVGRMALTNYLMHSLVFTTVANSYGLGLYGKIHPTQGLALCFGFYALQIPFSMLWLRNFNYGPAEWLWRTLTYGRKQPMRG